MYRIISSLSATTSRQSGVQFASDGQATQGRAVDAADIRLSSSASVIAGAGDLIYGTGDDGDIDLSGGAVSGFSLVSGVYRLTQHLNASNLVIREGYGVDPNGWIGRVRNTMTMENGTFISNDGGHASGITAGAGALPASAPTATSAPFYGGGAGGAGRSSGATGAAPATPTGFRLGGAGWVAQSAPSGGGATTTASVSASDVATGYNRYNGDIYSLLFMLARLVNGTNLAYANGAAGGSGGAWSSTSGGTGNTSGAGGGGGGVLVWAARKLVTTGTNHRFSANGANGSNASAVAGTNAAVGGGQGGSGGYLAVRIGTVVSGTAPIAEAKGGNGGNGAEFGYVSSGGNGGNGGKGGAGLYIIDNYSGAAPSVSASGGSAGTGSAHGVNGTAGTAGSILYPGSYA